MSTQELCFSVIDINPDTELDDPWFWSNDEEPIKREPNELEPFWR